MTVTTKRGVVVVVVVGALLAGVVLATSPLRLPLTERQLSRVTYNDGEMERDVDLKVSPPCPAYEDILPCTCMNYSTGRTYVTCDGALDEAVVYRALHSPGYGPNPIASLSANQGTIKTISRGLFSEVTCGMVFMSENQIDTLDSGALQPLFYDLEHIDLSHNLLPDPILEQVMDFRLLHDVDQSYNMITDLTPLSQLTRDLTTLTVLDLSGNLVSSVGAHTFKAFPNLIMIFLSFNRISYIDPLAFETNTELYWLELVGNQLNMLGSPEVGRIVTPGLLRYLELSENNIVDMLPGWVSSPQGMPMQIRLEREPMRLFPEEVYGEQLRACAAYGGTNAIALYNTYLECGCDLFWVVDDNALKDHLIGGRCGNESDGRPWHHIEDLDPDEMRPQCVSTTTAEPAGP